MTTPAADQDAAYVDAYSAPLAVRSPRTPDEKTWAVLIEHEKRIWDSEQRNAERLVDRTKVMSTLAALLLGVGLYKFDWLHNPNDVSRVTVGWQLFLIRTLMTLSLLMIGLAFWIGARPGRRHRRPSASHYLILRGNEVQNPPTSPDAAGAVLFLKMHRASTSLMLRNKREATKLRASSQFFFWGMGLAIAGLLLFLWCSVPPTISDERRAYERNAAHARP